MKIVTLNTWGGRAGREGLLAFFEKYKNEVDVFCLQEVWSAPYDTYEGHAAGGLAISHDHVMVYGLQEITAVLHDHAPYFRPHLLNDYGLAMFVRKDLSLQEEGELFVYRQKGYVPDGDLGNHARNIQYAMFNAQKEQCTVINFHGLWNGKGKTDSEDRLRQSENIITFLKTINVPYVLCGDFNLLPDTQSIRMFEEFGLRNLITEYGITSTRTSHYTKPEKYADYIFVSEGITVSDFRVLPEEVSDHAALLVEIA